MLNQIQLKRYAELSGYTEKALRDKISTGVWVEGLHYYRAPDRHILINVKEVEKSNAFPLLLTVYPGNPIIGIKRRYK